MATRYSDSIGIAGCPYSDDRRDESESFCKTMPTASATVFASATRQCPDYMTKVLTKEDLADELTVSMAQVVAAANRRARELGCDVSQRLVTISQHFDGAWFWRVNYGEKNPRKQRGGDLLIEVDSELGEVKRVLRGQ